jgi:hypothetical protein
VPTVEDRLRRIEDRTTIIERKYEYCRYADALDPALMVSLFTSDGVASYAPEAPDISGKDALLAFYSSALGTVVASSHHISNCEVDFIDDDHAQLSCYLYSWQRFADHPATQDRHRWARYIDDWVRTEHGWLQSRLSYRVAGELSSSHPSRVGEYLTR